MSDLFCPATVVLARHGEAEYEADTWSGEGGSLTRAGRRQARDLAGRLAARRIAHVYTSTLARAVQTAEIAAATLDLDVTTRVGLQEFSVGDHREERRDHDPFAETYAAWLTGDLDARVPGGESGREVVGRLRGVLEEIGDQFRGETVLVVAHGGILRFGVPALARMAPGVAPAQTPNCGTIEVRIDADGMVCTAWDPVPSGPGRPSPTGELPTNP